MSATYTGSCFCGAVEIEVTGAPVAMGYCHCRDCAHWSASPINAYSLWPKDSVRITKGEALVGVYHKTEKSYRKFCTACGGHLMNDHPARNLVDVFATVIQGFAHEPAMHVHYEERTVAIRDGLPKYKDVPRRAGGSGETMPD